jgi:hypothetical protein
MRSLAAAAVSVLACLALAATAPAQVVSTQATLDACHTGSDGMSRYARFTGQMGAVPHSERMQLRFDVYGAAAPGRRVHREHAPGLGTWQGTAGPMVQVLRVHKQVANLAAPGVYRAVVSFRWLAHDGSVIRRAQRRTAFCQQPDPRPDLAISAIDVQPSAGDPGRATYTVTVRNRGRGDAAGFGIALAVEGADQTPGSVPSLPAGQRATVVFDGPRCHRGGRVRAQADPADAVDEAREGNDALSIRCRPGA